MEKTIELKRAGVVIGVDFGSKDKSVITKMRRGKNGKITIEASWTMVKQLNQEEVNALPNGTKVLVLWNGGNGPYAYWTHKIGDGPVYTLDHLGKVNFGAGPLDFVGEDYPSTLVWLLES